MSSICENIYNNTPIVNSEVLNKDNITSIAKKSRIKLLNAILNNYDQENLGMSGNGQEVSFMRSTLKVTGILENINSNVNKMINSISDKNMRFLLAQINNFFEQASEREISFQKLYDKLNDSNYGIGMRKGIIPIYIAVIVNKYKKHISIKSNLGEEKLNADLLENINLNPLNYTVIIDKWNDSKQAYIDNLENIFNDYIINNERSYGGYKYLSSAMGRWYLSLPKYTRELKEQYLGYEHKQCLIKVSREKIRFLNIIKQTSGVSSNIIFNDLPRNFQMEVSGDSTKEIFKVKEFFDQVTYSLKTVLIRDTAAIFNTIYPNLQGSLRFIIEDWMTCLPKVNREQLYPNGAEALFVVADNMTNNEYNLIDVLAKAVIGLKIDDWNNDTPIKYCMRLKDYIQTIKSYSEKEEQVTVEDIVNDNNYNISFIDKSGHKYKKSFEKTEYSKRALVLYNEIQNALDEMGQSITPQEKRQVVIEILEKMC